MSKFTMAFLLGGVLLIHGVSSAQSSLFGNSGISSQSRSGSSSSAFGGSSLGGGMSGLGNTGGAGANSANAFGGMQLSQQGSLGSTLGQGFVGRGNSSGRTIGMGGNTSQGQQFGQGMQGFQNFGNFGGMGARGQRNSNFGNNFSNFGQAGRNMGAQRNQVTPIDQQQIRPQYRVAFEVPQTTSVTLSNDTRTRFDRIITRSVRGGNVKIELQPGGNVVIEGTVATESDRRMVETLVRMEGAVRHVDNHLVVQSSR